MTDSDRARALAFATQRQAEIELAGAKADRDRKLNSAVMSVLELRADEPEDTKLRKLQDVARARGMTPPPSSSIPPVLAARPFVDVPTQPSRGVLAKPSWPTTTPMPTPPPRRDTGEVDSGEGPPEWRARVASLPAPWSAPKVLVIDDDADIVDSLAEVLGGEGYRVWRAHDGLQGLERLFQMPSPGPDLILLDVMMPRVSGTDFLRVFDKTPFADVPVVVISAGTKPRDIDDGRFVFMAKPLDLQHILAVVREGVDEGRKLRRSH